MKLNRKHYNVCLSSKDEKWLKTIRDLICPTMPLVKDNKIHRICIYSSEICKWLLSKGINPNKSLTVKFPEVPKQFLPDFIRGCIDGDGTIIDKTYIRKTTRAVFRTIQCSLVSASKDFIDEFSHQLNQQNIKHSLYISMPGSKKHSKIDGREIIHKNPHYYVRTGHSQSNKLLEWIYYPKHKISLDRKRKLAFNIIKFYKTK